MKTIFYIVRHGESEANVSGEEDNSLNGLGSLLTERGKIQAKELGEKFRSIPFSAIYASDLNRTRQTAEIIAKLHDLAVVLTPALRERRYAQEIGKESIEMRRKLAAIIEVKSSLTEEEKFKIRLNPHMETGEEVIERYKKKLQELAKKHTGESILIVSHGNSTRTFLMHLGFAKHHELPTKAIKNTGYIKLSYDGEKFQVEETVGIEKEV